MGIGCIRNHSWDDSYIEKDTQDRENGKLVVRKKVRECSDCGEKEVLKKHTSATQEQPAQNNQGSASENITRQPHSEQVMTQDIEKDDSDTGVVIMDDDSTTEESDDQESTPQATSENQRDTHHTSEPGSEFDGGSFGANRDVGDVGPEGSDERSKAVEKETESVSADPDELVPNGEENDVEIMGSKPDTDSSTTPNEGTQTNQSATEPSDSTTTTKSDTYRDTDDDAMVTHAGDKQNSEPRSERSLAEAGTQNPESEAGVMLECPECGFRANESESPLFAGDACPECRSGYLNEE